MTIPAWPVPSQPTRDEAIAAAMAELDEGDTITAHREGCRINHDLERPCSCTPEVIVVREGRA